MCLNFLKLHSLCNEESIYIYEYMLIFSPKSWVCLGIQGHTPGAATGHYCKEAELLVESPMAFRLALDKCVGVL